MVGKAPSSSPSGARSGHRSPMDCRLNPQTDMSGILAGAPRRSIRHKVARADLPETTIDTRYRRDSKEIWLDNADEAVLYQIEGESVERWNRSSAGLCA